MGTFKALSCVVGRLAVLVSVALLGLALVAASKAGATGSATRFTVQGRSQVATPSRLLAPTPAGSEVGFSVVCSCATARAIAFAQAVSEPGSPQYRHFLSPANWERLFSPTPSSVEAVSSWLGSQGISVQGVTPDRMTISAKASAATIEHAFGVSLGEYRADGRLLRLASGSLSVPGSIAPLISGVVGISQQLATHSAVTQAEAFNRGVEGEEQQAEAPAGQPTGAAHPGSEEPIPAPRWRRTLPAAVLDLLRRKARQAAPELRRRRPSPLPWVVCGYSPAQLQGAYSVASPIAAGIDGRGVTVAVVAAYASPTLLSDAEEYSRKNEPSAPFSSSDFTEMLPSSYSEEEPCDGSGWFGEQAGGCRRCTRRRRARTSSTWAPKTAKQPRCSRRCRRSSMATSRRSSATRGCSRAANSASTSPQKWYEQ